MTKTILRVIRCMLVFLLPAAAPGTKGSGHRRQSRVKTDPRSTNSASLCLGQCPLSKRENNHAPWMNSTLGLGPLRCFRRRTCQQALTYFVQPDASWEAPIFKWNGYRSTLPNAPESRAFTIIAQPCPRWHGATEGPSQIRGLSPGSPSRSRRR